MSTRSRSVLTILGALLLCVSPTSLRAQQEPERSAATALMIAGSSALAQSAPADRGRQPRTETEGQSPSASENLSERLDRSKGVIQPPQVIDPSMQVLEGHLTPVEILLPAGL
jgi:hypothetical protein